MVVKSSDGKAPDVVRESDLEGHLQAEEANADHPVVTVEGPPEEMAPTKFADIAADPTKGRDFILAEGYRRLLVKLK